MYLFFSFFLLSFSCLVSHLFLLFISPSKSYTSMAPAAISFNVACFCYFTIKLIYELMIRFHENAVSGLSSLSVSRYFHVGVWGSFVWVGG